MAITQRFAKYASLQEESQVDPTTSKLWQRVQSGELTDTETLVQAVDASAEDESEVAAGLQLLDRYIEWFEKLNIEEITNPDLREYMFIIELKLRTPQAKRLLYRIQLSLAAKFVQDVYMKNELPLALIYSMEILEPEFYEGDPEVPLAVTWYLIETLYTGNYTDENLHENVVVVHVLHQAFVLVHKVDRDFATDWQMDGPFQGFLDKLDDIQQRQPSHYAAYFTQIMVENLNLVETEQKIDSLYTLFYHHIHSVYLKKCMDRFRSRLTMEWFDLPGMEKVLVEIRPIGRQEALLSKKWYEWLEYLRRACVYALDDMEKFTPAKEFFYHINFKGKAYMRNKVRRELKVGIVDFILLLARLGNKDVMNECVRRVNSLAVDCLASGRWTKDPEVFVTLLSAMIKLYHYEDKRTELWGKLKELSELTFRGLGPVIKEWLKGINLEERCEAEPVPTFTEPSGELFKKFMVKS